MLRALLKAEMLTYVLGIGLLGGLVGLGQTLRSYRLPDNQQGYEPRQPIAFSHQLHAGEMGINCRYCHNTADKSRHAGIPAGSVCMNCHRVVQASLGAIRAGEEAATKERRKPEPIVSPELAKLYDYLELDEDLEPRSDARPGGIPWVKVHNLPDYVSFDHRAHITAGVACQSCHGPIETMQRVRQVENLSMGWCVNCHREVNHTGVQGKPVSASTDCTTCHY